MKETKRVCTKCEFPKTLDNFPVAKGRGGKPCRAHICFDCKRKEGRDKYQNKKTMMTQPKVHSAIERYLRERPQNGESKKLETSAF